MTRQTETPMRVVARTQVAEDVVQLDLAAEDGAACAGWSAGAHVDLVSEDGLVRQYSLCGSEESRLRVAVLRVPSGRGGSAWVHDALTEGARVIVRGPRNNFPLEDAPAYLLIAGGIGITPILPMVRELAGRDAEWRLVYGGRTRASMAYAGELEAYGDRVLLVPQDEAGLIDLPEVLGEQVPGRRVYCCGPEPLLGAVEAQLRDRSYETLHVERFAAGEVDASGGSFEVELAASGVTITVAEGESIIDALAAKGVDVDFSCREGTCGTCETAVLGGVPDHRDSVLGDEEQATNDCMMICVGRCLEGPLVLDL